MSLFDIDDGKDGRRYSHTEYHAPSSWLSKMERQLRLRTGEHLDESERLERIFKTVCDVQFALSILADPHQSISVLTEKWSKRNG